MPGYIERSLHKLQHPSTLCNNNSLNIWIFYLSMDPEYNIHQMMKPPLKV